MMDIAENVSFGLELFERADQQQRLHRAHVLRPEQHQRSDHAREDA